MRRIGVDEYRTIVERRNTYVSQCMARAAVAGREPPLPPRKELEPTVEAQQEPALVPVKKGPDRLRAAERRKVKAAAFNAPKGKKIKAKQHKRFSRKRK